jgi:hypothetical protein
MVRPTAIGESGRMPKPKSSLAAITAATGATSSGPPAWASLSLAILLVACGRIGSPPQQGQDGGTALDGLAPANDGPADASAEAMSLFPDVGVEASTGPCNASTCDGCCQGGVCVKDITPQACGSSGQPCVMCAAGEGCKGTCFRLQSNCGPSNCDGCCIGPQLCGSGVSDVNCGSGGAVCTRCVPTEGTGQCVAQDSGPGGSCAMAQACGQKTCSGCCENGVCAFGSSNSACGTFGGQCAACAANEHCDGTCKPGPPCTPANCSGCCGGTEGNTCVPGTDTGACGIGGFICQNCTLTQSAATCVNGECVLPQACTAAACNGCCYGNICAEGYQTFLCGIGGQTCQNCSTDGKQCVMGACQ